MITFLTANTARDLALDDEVRSIQKEMLGATHGDDVVLKPYLAVQAEDLQRILLQDKPSVVHVSGHGDGERGIALHSAIEYEERQVDGKSLAELFRLLKGVRLVVLSACWSKAHADAIVKRVDFVVGMSDVIDDLDARIFATAFYRGLAFGRSVQDAFDLGVNELMLVGLHRGAQVPKLLVRAGADAAKTTLASMSLIAWVGFRMIES